MRWIDSPMMAAMPATQKQGDPRNDPQYRALLQLREMARAVWERARLAAHHASMGEMASHKLVLEISNRIENLEIELGIPEEEASD